MVISSEVHAGHGAALLSARLDRLPPTRTIWRLVLLLSLGSCFEFYDLFFTAYVGPGLVHSGLFSNTTESFFGFTGLGSFVAATFAGLFLGALVFGPAADRFGRRRIFTVSLLWYSAATVIMVFQTTAAGINLWRLITGIGIGVELVTVDTFIAELVPMQVRGRAFAFYQMTAFSAVPVAALAAWWLVPLSPLGFDGWRWVALLGSSGALVVWFIRLGLPESPRWLAGRGRLAEAEAIVIDLERKVAAESGQALPSPEPVRISGDITSAGFSEIWSQRYRPRTFMLLAFHVFQSIGYFGFASWVPTLLISKGVTVTNSLGYSVVIALANPLGPMLALAIADRIERKWVIVFSALAVAVFGFGFALQASDAWSIAMGVLVTLAINCMSYAYHAYQSELFPTRVRSRAVGMVYSLSRLSAMFSGFLIASCLRDFGVTGVFVLIGGAMAMVMIAVGGFGPRTNGLQLEVISS